MSRSGYCNYSDVDDYRIHNLYRGRVVRTIKGKKGQAFLRELAKELDAMPVKELITDALVTEDGACCSIGVVCKARGLDVSDVEVYDPAEVGDTVGISLTLAAEIEYENDEVGPSDETPAERWTRMRKWVESNLK